MTLTVPSSPLTLSEAPIARSREAESKGQRARTPNGSSMTFAFMCLVLSTACASGSRVVDPAPVTPTVKVSVHHPCAESIAAPAAPAAPSTPAPLPPDFVSAAYGPDAVLDEHHGLVSGVVKGRAGEALEGVTVVATSSSLQGTQAELTDAAGTFALTALPAGTYVLTFYYGELVIERTGLEVRSGVRTRVNQVLDTASSGGETITIEQKVGRIESTPRVRSWCAELNTECGSRVPLPGRTFEGSLSVVVVGPPPKRPCR